MNNLYRTRTCTTIVLVLLGLDAAHAQNNNCSGAITLAMANTNYHVDGTVAGATQSIPAITCNGSTGSADDDVWFKFVATSTDAYVELLDNPSFDGVLDIRSGACNGTNIACANSSGPGGYEFAILSGLTIGSTYYVRVYDLGTGQPADPTFQIGVFHPSAPPANDDCPAATPISVGTTCQPTDGSVNEGTQSLPAITCGSFTGDANDDVWFKFVATLENVQIHLECNEFFDGVIDLRSGACNGVNIGCSDDNGYGGLEVLYAQDLTLGSTYYIRVYDFDPGYPSNTDFTICAFQGPPAFDECGGAIQLPMQGDCVPVTGDALGATDSDPDGSDLCNGLLSIENDVWYSFVATSGDVRITVDGNGNYDPLVRLRSGCPGNPILCVNETGAGGVEVLEFQGIIIGNTYYVQIHNAGFNQPTNTTFTICVQDISLAAGMVEAGPSPVPWHVRVEESGRSVSLCATRGLRTEWQVFDALGRCLARGNATLGASWSLIDLHDVAAGTYTVLLSGEGRRQAEHIVLH